MLTLENILQGLMAASGAVAMVLIARGSLTSRKWGWTIGAVFQPAWLYVTWCAGQWGMFALSCVYTWGFWSGAWSHWRAGRAAP